MADFVWRGPQVAASMRAAGARGVNRALARLHALAVEAAPIQDGILRGSAGIAEAVPADPAGSVYFDTPYAVRQHEELDYRHPQGGGPKYLERPLQERAGELRGIIAAEMRRAAG